MGDGATRDERDRAVRAERQAHGLGQLSLEDAVQTCWHTDRNQSCAAVERTLGRQRSSPSLPLASADHENVSEGSLVSVVGSRRQPRARRSRGPKVLLHADSLNRRGGQAEICDPHGPLLRLKGEPELGQAERHDQGGTHAGPEGTATGGVPTRGQIHRHHGASRAVHRGHNLRQGSVHGAGQSDPEDGINHQIGGFEQRLHALVQTHRDGETRAHQ